MSLLVALGWYATVIAAVLVGRSAIPTPPQVCSEAFTCLTPQEELALLALFGAPILAVLLFITLVVTGPLARRVPYSILAGTLSALGSVGVMAAADALWKGIR